MYIYIYAILFVHEYIRIISVCLQESLALVGNQSWAQVALWDLTLPDWKDAAAWGRLLWLAELLGFGKNHGIDSYTTWARARFVPRQKNNPRNASNSVVEFVCADLWLRIHVYMFICACIGIRVFLYLHEYLFSKYKFAIGLLMYCGKGFAAFRLEQRSVKIVTERMVSSTHPTTQVQ